MPDTPNFFASMQLQPQTDMMTVFYVDLPDAFRVSGIFLFYVDLPRFEACTLGTHLP
jgi:hypothetical protein